MSEYRVISDGRNFRVQKRIFCLFWKTEEFVNIGGGLSYLEFDSLKAAKQHIKDRHKEEIASLPQWLQWNVVWEEDDWPELDLSRPPQAWPAPPKRSEQELTESGEKHGI